MFTSKISYFSTPLLPHYNVERPRLARVVPQWIAFLAIEHWSTVCSGSLAVPALFTSFLTLSGSIADGNPPLSCYCHSSSAKQVLLASGILPVGLFHYMHFYMIRPCEMSQI